MTEEEKKAVEELQTAAIELKTLAQLSEDEKKKYGDALGETKAALDLANKRIDELEIKIARPGNPSNPDLQEQEKDEKQKKAFLNYMRKGMVSPGEEKAFVTSDDPNAGYLVPNPVKAPIIEKIYGISPIRQIADVDSIAKDMWEAPVELGDIAVSKKSEKSTPVETSTDGAADWLGLLRIIPQEMYAMPKISQKMLEDNGYNLESFLISRIAKAFAKKEGAWFISGNGSDEAEGILTNTTLIANHHHSGHATILQAGTIISLTYALSSEFTANAKFILERKTVGLIRAMKDAVTGTFIWQPAFAVGEPPTIMGYPIVECPDMPAVASATVPIVFGDFAQGYKIVDRTAMSMLRDPYSSKGFISFYTTRRVGGAVQNTNALIHYYMAT